MRRKNLTVTIGLVLVLVLLHGMGIPLKQSVLSAGEQTAGQSHHLTGLVTKTERTEEGRYRLQVHLESADGHTLRKKETILLWYEGEAVPPWELYLQNISFYGILKEPETRRNPACFDYRLYLKSQNIFWESSADRLELLEKERQRAAQWIGDGLRWLMEQRFTFMDCLHPDAAGLVSGMLFGDTSMLEEDIYEDFRSSGTAHVLAVSGLHVGILYAMYKKVCGNRQTVWSMLFLALVLCGYGILSMWSPSMCRAAVMIGLREIATFFDLRYDMATGLSTTALIFIVQNPYCIFGAGFQMSFLAIGSICFLTPLLPGKLPDTVASGLAVNLGLLLYQSYQFNSISLVSIFINIPIIYLTGILVPVSLTCFAVFSAAGSLPSVCHLLLDSLSFFTVNVNAWSTLSGYGSVDVVSPPLWLVFSGYFLLFFFSSEQNLVLRSRHHYRTLRRVVLGGLVCCFLFSTMFRCPVSRADVVFVDVGQGDCIHIRDGFQNVLIDGGGSRNYNIGKDTLKPYLLKNGVWNVDLALATHTHMDHYQGLEELAAVYPVKKCRTGLTAGENIIISDSVWIETLWPLEIDPEKGQEENEACSVFMVHYDEWKILITGDLDEAGETAMVEHYERLGESSRLKADILKIGHHGSSTSTGDRFLDLVNPQAAVIQVGKNNIYGHPSQIIVEKCQKRDIIILRNDYNGGIGFSFQKDRYRIDTVL